MPFSLISDEVPLLMKLHWLKRYEIILFLGCGLDVLRQEPIDVNHPLLKLDNAVIVPHIGSASRLTRDRMVQLCVNNILAVLNHQLPITPVKVNN